MKIIQIAKEAVKEVKERLFPVEHQPTGWQRSQPQETPPAGIPRQSSSPALWHGETGSWSREYMSQPANQEAQRRDWLARCDTWRPGRQPGQWGIAVLQQSGAIHPMRTHGPSTPIPEPPALGNVVEADKWLNDQTKTDVWNDVRALAGQQDEDTKEVPAYMRQKQEEKYRESE